MVISSYEFASDFNFELAFLGILYYAILTGEYDSTTDFWQAAGTKVNALKFEKASQLSTWSSSCDSR